MNALFMDPRDRAAAKYGISKVVDRLKDEKPRCSHVTDTELR